METYLWVLGFLAILVFVGLWWRIRASSKQSHWDPQQRMWDKDENR